MRDDFQIHLIAKEFFTDGAGTPCAMGGGAIAKREFADALQR